MATVEMTGEEILKHIKESSNERKEKPIPFFHQLLATLWQRDDKLDTFNAFINDVQNNPWTAEDTLICLKFIIDHPLPNLAEIFQEEGWVYLSDRNGNELGNQEYLEWLKLIYLYFLDVYNKPPESPKELEYARDHFNKKMEELFIWNEN